VKIGRGSAVGPSTVVDEDVPDATRAYVRQDQARTRYAPPRDAAERRP
jgi:serine acetyltransferase